MKISYKKISTLIVVSLFLFSACAGNNWDENQKTIIGGVGGAAAGGLIASTFGANTAGVLGGAILGGLIGGAVGNRMDAADRREANRTTYRALETTPSGTTASWKNPDSSNSGTVTPTHTYQAQNGEYCREFEQTITIGGETQEAYGTACRQPDGTWQVVQ
ncbi:MAG: glycine zipper 2TM domain-containing protein [Deltaproteobacteria bacterium]|nr:glycine zipper 2TM domain-containing protein [Deltaproteobacteria bacterium]